MKKSLFFLIGCFLTMNFWAQDPNFSHFYNNPIYYNSALTGINSGTTIHLNTRNLWGPIPGKFNTFSGSVETQSYFKTNFGFHCFSDVGGEGFLRTQGYYFNYSYRAVESKNIILQAGLSGGFIHKSIDFSKLTFSDQYHPTLGLIQPSSFIQTDRNVVNYADFGAGAVIRFNGKSQKAQGRIKQIQTTIGTAIHHISKPQDAFLNGSHFLPIKWTFHTNSNILVKKFVLSPGLIYEIQNEFKTLNIGSSFIQRPFSFGLWFRKRSFQPTATDFDSFIFNIGSELPLKYFSQCKINYSYDITISRLRTSSFGTHEVSLVFSFDKLFLFQRKLKEQALKRKFDCPLEFKGY